MAPNDVWCVDFKGWFRTGDGATCYPLTVTDAFSRYLLCCRAIAPDYEGGRRLEPTVGVVDQTRHHAGADHAR